VACRVPTSGERNHRPNETVGRFVKRHLYNLADRLNLRRGRG
jgi:hypothetical protein